MGHLPLTVIYPPAFVPKGFRKKARRTEATLAPGQPKALQAASTTRLDTAPLLGHSQFKASNFLRADPPRRKGSQKQITRSCCKTLVHLLNKHLPSTTNVLALG